MSSRNEFCLVLYNEVQHFYPSRTNLHSDGKLQLAVVWILTTRDLMRLYMIQVSGPRLLVFSHVVGPSGFGPSLFHCTHTWTVSQKNPMHKLIPHGYRSFLTFNCAVSNHVTQGYSRFFFHNCIFFAHIWTQVKSDTTRNEGWKWKETETFCRIHHMLPLSDPFISSITYRNFHLFCGLCITQLSTSEWGPCPQSFQTTKPRIVGFNYQSTTSAEYSFSYANYYACETESVSEPKLASSNRLSTPYQLTREI